MRGSLILRTAARPLLALCVALSVFILLRGHNEPGGGFIGGLIASLGVAFFALAHGRARALRMLRLDPKVFVGAGLLLALGAGLPAPLLHGEPLLTQQWGALGLGTTLVFDLGVYLAVLGFALSVLLPFAEE